MTFTPTEETLIDDISLNEFIVRNKTATFMMRVASENYAAKGILRGDILVVERNVIPKPHDLIVNAHEAGWSLIEHKDISRDTPCIVVRGIVRTYV